MYFIYRVALTPGSRTAECSPRAVLVTIVDRMNALRSSLRREKSTAHREGYLGPRTIQSTSFRVVSYRLPRNAHTPQLPHETSEGSTSFRSHRRLRNRFSPGSISRSYSPPTFSSTHRRSRCMSHSVYPVQMMGTLVSSSCGSVSSHSWDEAGWPRPGWKSMKQSK